MMTTQAGHGAEELDLEPVVGHPLAVLRLPRTLERRLVNKIPQLLELPIDVPISPPAEVVGFFVRWIRGLRNWKISTLANFARVSISTIERVERGEKVSDETLDGIARALGYEAGYFIRPRIRIPMEEVAADTNLEPVPVAPMRSHRVVREAARCHYIVVHRPDLSDQYNGDIAALLELLDLASFTPADFVEVESIIPADVEWKRPGKRALYNNVLDHVRELERRGLTVLCGVISAPQDGVPDWTVAIISITQRTTDPGAAKRRHVMVDRRAVEPPPKLKAALSRRE